MEILTLPAAPAHLPTVAGWIYAEFIDGIRAGITLAEITAALQGRQPTALPLTYVGVIGETCVGTVSLVENDLRARPDLTPWLASLFVPPAHRGQGIAQQLIDKATATAADLGFPALYLRTEHTAAYYVRLGWQRIDATVDEFGLFTEVFQRTLR